MNTQISEIEQGKEQGKIESAAVAQTQSEPSRDRRRLAGTDQTPALAAKASIAVLEGQLLSDSAGNAYRTYCVVVLVVSACALWSFTLSKLGVSTEALPWYITVTAIAAFYARFMASPPKAQGLLNHLRSFLREPLTLNETWALTYILLSVALYAWVSLQAITPVESKRRKLLQVVDIRLCSDADFANQNATIPGTQEQKEQHKRDSDPTTAQGSLTPHPAAAKPQKSAQRQQAATQQPLKQQQVEPHNKSTPAAALPEHQALATLPSRESQIAAPSKLAPAQASIQGRMEKQKQDASPASVRQAERKSEQKAQSKQLPYFEEIEPAELVEMMENDGSRTSQTVFQSGGRSAGGTGAENDLSAYIKELHKRIKTSWTPPRGQSRRVKVLFRIRKDGHLALVRLLASSGDKETDAAALNSIDVAVKERPLPANYEFAYLDMEYTFNYSADELREVKNPVMRPAAP